ADSYSKAPRIADSFPSMICRYRCWSSAAPSRFWRRRHPGTRPSVEEGGTALLRPPRIAGRDSGVEGAAAGAPRAKDVQQPSAGEAVAAKSPETDVVVNAINGAAPELKFLRGFRSAEQFAQAVSELRSILRQAGITDATIGVRGSSVSGSSFRTGGPFGQTS